MADILIHFFKNLSFPTLQNARVFQMLQGRESLFDRQANKPKGQNQAQVDISDDGSSHKTASLIMSYKKYKTVKMGPIFFGSIPLCLKKGKSWYNGG